MKCAVMQRGLFADCKERQFQAVKRSDKSSTIREAGRLANAQESPLQCAKRRNMSSAVHQ